MVTEIWTYYLLIITIALLFFLVFPNKFILKNFSKLSARIVLVFIYFGLIGLFGALFSNSVESERNMDSFERAKNKLDSGMHEESLKLLEDLDESFEKYDSVRIMKDSIYSYVEKERKARLKAIDEEAKARFETSLQSSIDRAKSGWAKPSNKSTVESLSAIIAEFSNWEAIADKAIRSSSKEIKAKGNELKKLVEREKGKHFPAIRKFYAKRADKIFWESDIDVFSSGSRHQYITFVGGLFAANRNIKDFHERMNEVLNDFRFKQARYKWYDGADEYTYYTIYEGSDND